MHPMQDTWVLWAHLPHDSNWSIDSYIKVMTIKHVEEIITLLHDIPDKLVVGCMFFIMKENILPTWEDDNNKHGGCFSYKIQNHIPTAWRDMAYSIVGRTLTRDPKFNSAITGISISPKKKFCILKLWMNTCKYNNPEVISIIKPGGCIFKKH